MIYFKTIHIPTVKKEKIEKAIRSFSLKRHASLDFKQTASYIQEKDKVFLARETQEHIQLTRLRNPLEVLLPKLIIQFNKTDFNRYKIRYSFTSFFVAILLVIALISNIIKGNFSTALSFILVFIILTYIEVQINMKKVNTIISSCNNV